MGASTSGHGDGPGDDTTGPTAPVDGPVTRRLFGFDFIDDAGVDATVERILGPQPDDGRLPLVATPNVDQLVRLEEPGLSDLHAFVTRARYVLPDGQPIVWASRLLRRPLTARLPGSTLVPPIWRRAAAEHLPVVVVASTDEIAERLGAEHPGATFVVPPFYDAEDQGAAAAIADEVAEAVRTTAPRLVFVGVGFPKRERLALDLLDRLDPTTDAPLVLLIGAAFSMYLDITPRAPEWMQRAGLEWFYRFILEPRRLFRRYFITDAKFARIVARELRAGRRR